MLKLFKIALSLCLVACSFAVNAIYPVAVQKETADYILDIKYPQGFKDPRIDATLQGFIEYAKQRFFKELAADADIPADAPGKSGLNITYSLPYQTRNALSVRFMISSYHKGAAHPANSIGALNFINGSQVQLVEIFRPEAEYLKLMAAFCAKQITAKNISDPKWIDEGTKPTDDNYKIWSFSSKGIDVIFDTYQVAAYVYGPQTVSLPFSQIAALLKPEVAQRVWGR